MATYITGVRMSPPTAGDHQHISDVRWEQSASSGICSRQAMIEFVEKGNSVWVRGNPNAQVAVIDGPPKYLRTQADGSWSNNLLNLPALSRCAAGEVATQR